MKYTKTPYGDDCISEVDECSRLGNLILSEANGSWQREVLENLMLYGYVVGYRATGTLRGRARSYQGKYAESLSNLMGRLKVTLPKTSPFLIRSGPVGPKGGFGFYLTEFE